MRKDYRVISISASVDRGTDVTVLILEERFIHPQKGAAGTEAYFSGEPAHYFAREYSTAIQMPFSEYQQSGLRVGDRLSLSITKLRPGKEEVGPRGSGGRQLGLFGPTER